MKIKQLPKTEDVTDTDIDLDPYKVSVISATDENRDYLVEAAISTYLGEKCK